ncbi:MAG TPA: threonine/serine dehydratase [Candidatus Dormibacteraeota bacterium]
MTQTQTDYLAAHAAQIAEAAQTIRPHIRRTPILRPPQHDQLTLKPECFQVTGSFKTRGAFNAVFRLKATHPDTKGVIAVSSGNHAQALALAAQTAGLPALILIPEDANPAKIAATRGYGATVKTEGITFANREEQLQQAAQETGFTIVHPFDNWDIIHGAGTAAREVLEDDPETQTIVAPTGGGGLLSGTALSAKHHNPQIRVIGVEPERADDAARTLKTGQIQRLPDSPDTIADGVRTVSIGHKNFEVIVEQGLVDDIVTVSEEQIAEATRYAWLDLKLALEPTGALPLAAYLSNKRSHSNGQAQTALILSGGNANPNLISRLLSNP